jgi:hypothetical protein
MCIMLTMPVTSATAERSFSVLRRLKTYVRSTMNNDRKLSSLALMHSLCGIVVDQQPQLDLNSHSLLKQQSQGRS